MNTKLLLASGSPRRHDLLQKAGYAFQCYTPQVEEIIQTNDLPEKLAQTNATLKATAASLIYAEKIVMGADTIVDLEGKVLGKPKDFDEAEDMLRRLQNRTHRVITAVTLIARTEEKMKEFLVCSRVTFHPLTDAEIQKYIREFQPFDKAGAYAAQEDHGRIIRHIDGSFTNVVGLPMEQLARELNKTFGITPASTPADSIQ